MLIMLVKELFQKGMKWSMRNPVKSLILSYLVYDTTKAVVNHYKYKKIRKDLAEIIQSEKNQTLSKAFEEFINSKK
jgi:hypothetical protein